MANAQKTETLTAEVLGFCFCQVYTLQRTVVESEIHIVCPRCDATWLRIWFSTDEGEEDNE